MKSFFLALRIGLFLIAALLALPLAHSQSPENYPCAAAEMQRRAMDSFPELALRQAALDEQIRYFIEANEGKKGAAAILNIPVVVHIIHQNGTENISDTRVQTAIQHLNEAFAHSGPYAAAGAGTDVEIRFCLAQRTPDEQATNGITRDQSALTDMIMETQDLALKNLHRWDPAQYLNIWVVRSISSNAIGPGVAGYAYYASAHGAAFDGIVCEAQYFGNTAANDVVLIHEAGHYLNLYHTFEGGCTNNLCDQQGDRVCDTPPDQATHSGCVYNSCNSDADDVRPINPLTTDVGDMTENYMDYSPFSCQHAFTPGQSLRMRAALEGVRKSLLQSPGCQLPCPLVLTADFTTPAAPHLTGTAYTFSYSGSGATVFNWTVNGASVPGNTILTHTFTSPGTYIIALNTGNNNPDCADVFRDTIEVMCNIASIAFMPGDTSIQQGATLQFNGNAPGATQFQWEIDGLPVGANSSTLTYTFNDIRNYFIRLKAANPWCSLSTYGQVVVESPCGDSIWQSQYSGINAFAPRSFPLSDGAHLLIGQAYFSSSSTFIVKLNPDGSFAWGRRRFTQAIGEGVAGEFPDGTYFVAYTYGSQPGRTQIEKISANNGSIIWSKQLDRGNVRDLCMLPDGSLVLLTGSAIIKLDGNGNLIWAKTTPGGFSSLERRADGGFFCAIHDSPNNQRIYAHLDAGGNLLQQVAVPNNVFGGSERMSVLPDNSLAAFVGFNQQSYLLHFSPNLNLLWSKVNNNGYSIYLRANRLGDILVGSAIANVGDNYVCFKSDGSLKWTSRCITPQTSSGGIGNGPYLDEGWSIFKQTNNGFYQIILPTSEKPEGCYFSPGENTYSNTPLIPLVSNVAFSTPTINITNFSVNSTDFTLTRTQVCRMPLPCPVICGDTLEQFQYRAQSAYFHHALPAADGSMRMMGTLYSPLTNFYVKLAANGDVIWSKSIEFPEGAWVCDIEAGNTLIAAAIDNSAKVIKVDGAGNIIWVKDFFPFFSPGGNYNLVKFNDNTALIQGASKAVKFDSDGNVIWAREFPNNAEGFFSAACPDGSTWVQQRTLDEFQFIKLSASGQVLSARSLQSPNGYWGNAPIFTTADGGLVSQMLSQENGIYYAYIFKTDALGDIQWHRKIETTLNVWGLSTHNNHVLYGHYELPNYDRFLTLLDENGEVLWTQKVNLPTSGNINSIGANAKGWIAGMSGGYNVVVEDQPQPKANCLLAPYEKLVFEQGNFNFQTINYAVNPLSITASASGPIAWKDMPLTKIATCTTYTPCNEICDNGADDDNDGLADCEDPDCGCAPCTAFDGEISIDSIWCAGETTRVQVLVCNRGKTAIPAGLKVSFYGADPLQQATLSLTAAKGLGTSIAPDNCQLFEFSLNTAFSGDLYAVLNDEQNTAPPFNFPLSNLPECSFLNNLVHKNFTPPANPPLDLGPDRSVCANSVTNLQANAGFERYRWQNGATESITTAFGPGLYWVDAWDACGKKHTDSIRLTLQPLGAVELGPDQTLCSGDSLTLQLNGFDAISWWPEDAVSCTNCSTTTLKPLQNMVIYAIASSNNCFASDSMRIEVAPPPNLALGPDLSICAGASTTLSTALENNVQYSWSGGQSGNSLIVSQSGVYILNAALGNCTAADTVQVNVLAAPLVDLGLDQNVCAGENVTLSTAPENNVQYTWSGGQSGNSLIVSQSGVYILNAALGNCTAADTVQVNVLAAPLVDLGLDQNVCAGANVTLSTVPENNVQYTWSGGQSGNSLTVSQSGVYILNAALGNCTATDTVQVNVLAAPLVDLGLDQNLCAGENVTLSTALENSVQYTWSGGQSGNSLIVSQPGVYILNAALGNCTATDTVQVNVLAAPLVDLGLDQDVCAGASTTLSTALENNVQYSWSGGQSGNSLIVSQSGVYILNAALGNCTAADTVQVNVLAAPVVDLGLDRQICPGDSIQLGTVLQTDVSYLWNIGAVTNNIQATEPGLYWLQASLGDCFATDSLTISIKTCEVPTEIYLPNAFAPESSGDNAVYLPGISPLMEVLEYRMEIYDRWGELLFRTGNPTQGWDGRARGRAALPGVYVVLLVAKVQDQGRVREIRKSGDLLLMR